MTWPTRIFTLCVALLLAKSAAAFAQSAETPDDEAAIIAADRLKDLPFRYDASPAVTGFEPAWRKYAAAPITTSTPKIAIILDDVGLSEGDIDRLLDYPPLTLALLPYATDLAPKATKLRAVGHELMVHLPMQPKSFVEVKDPGPNALLTGLPKAELDRRIDWNLGQFDAFVGVNNHMGSAFTEQAEPMRFVMTALKKRGLFFLDSLTTPKSVGRRLARQMDIPFLARDIFLDNIATPDAIQERLAEAEEVAQRRGEVIVIGHPYPQTLDTLRQWFMTLPGKNLTLVPISQLVSDRVKRESLRGR